MEIGSEFWEACDTGRKKYFLSGRTSLEYIIRDILEDYKIESVLLPSYCCHTMIEPFVRHEIKVKFYDVFFDGKNGLRANLPELRKHEIFYFMTYFGFSAFAGIDLNKVKEADEVIIEDRTHSWLSSRMNCAEKALGNEADYVYASLRKWAGFYGIAEAQKKIGYFHIPVGNVGETYSAIRKDAMRMKRDYFESIAENGEACGNNAKEEQKERFLARYSEAEELLGKDYVGYTPTDECLMQLVNTDFDFIKRHRKDNADILIDGLKDVSGCRLLFCEQAENDTPLFVPILIENNRDSLRRYLIEHRVYCPVHWPFSSYHQGVSDRGKEIYGKELSLVCDQRYGKEDMERIVRLVTDYFNEGI